ncbi:hypothetical protein [Micromonospora sp. LOL_024]
MGAALVRLRRFGPSSAAQQKQHRRYHESEEDEYDRQREHPFENLVQAA